MNRTVATSPATSPGGIVPGQHEVDGLDREQHRAEADERPRRVDADEAEGRRASPRCTGRTARRARIGTEAHRQRALARRRRRSGCRGCCSRGAPPPSGRPTTNEPQTAVLVIVLDLHELRPAGGDEAEEHEHHQLTEAEVAVRLRSAGVERRRERSRRRRRAAAASRPRAARSETRQRGHDERPAIAAAFTARGDARPEADQTDGPRRCASVPRTPSE